MCEDSLARVARCNDKLGSSVAAASAMMFIPLLHISSCVSLLQHTRLYRREREKRKMSKEEREKEERQTRERE